MTYREVQRYPVRDVIFITVLSGAILTMALVQIILGKSLTVWEGILAVVVGTGLIGGIWYINRIKMTMRINEKNLKLKYGPLKFDQCKIKWKSVDDIELIRLPRFYKWRGWDVHYSSGNKWYNLNGKAVIKLTLKDGQTILVGCNELETLEEVLQQFEKTRDLVHREEEEATHVSSPVIGEAAVE